MKWFEGSIAEAVNSSKQKNAVFVVFIEGNDAVSKTMISAMDKPDISSYLESNKFVSVKLENGSESHNQFTEIYKLVPVPSVFFIGQNGAPLEIVAGEASENDVVNKLEAAIYKSIGKPKPSSKDSSIPSVKLSSDPGTSKEEAEQTIPPEPSKSPPLDVKKEQSPAGNAPQSNAFISAEIASAESLSAVPALEVQVSPSPTQEKPEPAPEEPEKPQTSLQQSSVGGDKDEKERLMALLEKKKEERKLQEEREEKEKELERRKLGQVLGEAKKKQQERELQDLRMERLKEKQAEKEAKQRVLDQIAQDRAERAARFSGANKPSVSPSPPPAPAVEPEPRPTTSNVDVSARLQFKMPDGSTKTHTFPAETTLSQVRQFIDNNIVLSFSEYQMATMFPRREFTFRDNNLDLRQLQLLPSSVILIMPLQGSIAVSAGPSWPKMFMNMLWDLMQPLFSFSRYLQSLVWRGGNTTGRGSSDPAPSPSQPERPTYPPRQSQTRSGVRKRGNIHSLADNDSSNDENNTWNGNSTQQM